MIRFKFFFYVLLTLVSPLSAVAAPAEPIAVIVDPGPSSLKDVDNLNFDLAVPSSLRKGMRIVDSKELSTPKLRLDFLREALGEGRQGLALSYVGAQLALENELSLADRLRLILIRAYIFSERGDLSRAESSLLFARELLEARVAFGDEGRMTESNLRLLSEIEMAEWDLEQVQSGAQP